MSGSGLCLVLKKCTGKGKGLIHPKLVDNSIVISSLSGFMSTAVHDEGNRSDTAVVNNVPGSGYSNEKGKEPIWSFSGLLATGASVGDEVDDVLCDADLLAEDCNCDADDETDNISQVMKESIDDSNSCIVDNISQVMKESPRGSIREELSPDATHFIQGN
ncbi:hypothetical protein L6452_17485 [Arctium lappa]|uniref:Uncharacterized protein n=1 Tax=Arctium lappa TaxID=4217 RepID=A0ACB9C3H8_ARCLA|nr:hypothetical protein L6452_17485 [Arctium lappa]